MGGAGSKAAKRAFPAAKPSGAKPSVRVNPAAAEGAPQSDFPSSERPPGLIGAPAAATAAEAAPVGDLGGSLQEGSSPEEDPGGEAWAKDTAQASALDRLAGSITNRDVGTQPLQAGSLDRRWQPPKRTRRVEAAAEGRLTVEVLRLVLEEAQRATLAGTAVDIGALAQKFEADEKLLQDTLRFVQLPVLRRNDDGTFSLAS